MCETIMEAVSLTKHFRSADKTWFTAVDLSLIHILRPVRSPSFKTRILQAACLK